MTPGLTVAERETILQTAKKSLMSENITALLCNV